MNKAQFLNELTDRLYGIPVAEIEKSLSYYDEIISDRVEDGMTEEEAVFVLGDIDKIAKNAKIDMPFSTLIKEKFKKGGEKLNKTENKWLFLL